MKILLKDEPVLGRAHEKYQKFTRDEELRHLDLAREMFQRDRLSALDNAKEMGFEQGIEKGIEQGIEKGIEHVANQLKALGTDPAVISKTTGLSLDAISKL